MKHLFKYLIPQNVLHAFESSEAYFIKSVMPFKNKFIAWILGFYYGKFQTYTKSG